MSFPGVLLPLALLLYLASTLAFIGHLITIDRGPLRWAYGALAGACGLHAAALGGRAAMFGYGAFAPVQEELSIIGCISVLLYLILAVRVQLTVVGALVAPMGFVFTLSAYLFESGHTAVPNELASLWLPAHVVPAFLGYAIFAVSSCLSIVYLAQESQLKGKRKGGWFRKLPSLEILDNLSFRFVTWGFAALTIALITGSFLARELWGALWSWEPVQIYSVLTWLLYAILLHARTVGWRGRRAAQLTIACFVVLALSFIGVNLFFPGKHGGSLG